MTVNRTAPPFRTPPENAPGRFRGPFARWPRAADAGLALASFVMTVFVVDGPGDTLLFRSIGDAPILVLVGCAVANPALYWRRRAPLLVLGVALTTWAVLLGGGTTHLGWPTIIGLYAVGRYAAVDWRGPAGAAAATALASVDGLDDPGPWWQVPVFGSLVMFGAWYVGRRVQLRGDRAAQLRRERAAETRRIVTDERTRIARELHDVVAHRVSLMTVQASGARAVAAEDLAAALRAMEAVEEAGRQALEELRHLLGVLRPETSPDDLGPQPSLAELPRLIEQIRRAGVDVTLATDGLPAGLPARLDLFAYRIIQEALTNVLKHAGPGAPATVSLVTEQNGLVIEVRDDGRGAAALEPGAVREGLGGHGIIGMRERALLLGGSLDAGPAAGGGFRVVARLPIGGSPA
ncbi:histidine kinase [Parafrankia soli]|uniref:histidine kinase n=1 Tax=Parafrankia soli TaxID=2599596 RepID=A0A1S1Q4S2_9ACTN|nr:histidine kinase [Parafrankia soli]